jgi:hypothetical protein
MFESLLYESAPVFVSVLARAIFPVADLLSPTKLRMMTPFSFLVLLINRYMLLGPIRR